MKVLVIGAGLAGCEVSYSLAKAGVSVCLVESKGIKLNPAQKQKDFAELVCTNSLKSKDPYSAHGLLKREMESLGSIVMEVAKETAVPAGNALAVDRTEFSRIITEKIISMSKIEFIQEEVVDPVEMAARYGCQLIVMASGPMTMNGLSEWIQNNISPDDFYFYDAIAPVVDADSLDYSKLYFKDRYKDFLEGEVADYLNVPMLKKEYTDFVLALTKGEKVPARNFESYSFFESCLPVDVMAERGEETLRFSCMKPVGLEQQNGERPYAVIQLRRENLAGSAFNMVGFQTRLTHLAQLKIFRMIPGFEKAEFFHLGSIHRNSFLNSKKLLNYDFSLKQIPNIYFTGQLVGVEGYTESAAMGQYVAIQILRKLKKMDTIRWPYETGIGALVNYVMTVPKPRPSNINFGILPEVELQKGVRMKRKERKKLKKELAVGQAHKVFDQFVKNSLSNTIGEIT